MVAWCIAQVDHTTKEEHRNPFALLFQLERRIAMRELLGTALYGPALLAFERDRRLDEPDEPPGDP